MDDPASTTSRASAENKSSNNAAESNSAMKQRKDDGNKSNATKAVLERKMKETQQRLNDDSKSLEIASLFTYSKLVSDEEIANRDNRKQMIERFLQDAGQSLITRLAEQEAATAYGMAAVNNERTNSGLEPSTSSPIYGINDYSKKKNITRTSGVGFYLLLIFAVPAIVAFIVLFLIVGVVEDDAYWWKLYHVVSMILCMGVCSDVLSKFHLTITNHKYDLGTCFWVMNGFKEKFFAFMDITDCYYVSEHTKLLQEVCVAASCNGIGPTYIASHIKCIRNGVSEGTREFRTSLDRIKKMMERKLRYDTALKKISSEEMSNEKLEKEQDFFFCMVQMIDVIPLIKNTAGNYIFSITNKELNQMEETKKLEKCTVVWYKYLHQSYSKAIAGKVDITKWDSDGMKKILDGPYNLDVFDVALTDFDYQYRFDIFDFFNMKDCQIIAEKDKDAK